MAVTDAYATLTQYKAIIGKTTPADDVQIPLDLTAMSRVMERDVFGGRFFTKDGGVTTRLYPPTYFPTLNVQDIADLTGLIVKLDANRDGVPELVLTRTTDFEVWPLNAGAGPEPSPFTQLFLPPRVTRYYWTEYVEVTALHGWPAIPSAVTNACCQFVAILRVESPRATQRISEGIDSVASASPRAREILDSLTAAYGKPAWVYG